MLTRAALKNTGWYTTRMRVTGTFLLLIAAAAIAQSPEPAELDPRLAVHTLVREDLFAGFLANDMERFTRGEKNLQILLSQRPQARPEILALQGSAAVYRAVLAHEAKQEEEYARQYARAQGFLSEAGSAGPGDPAVAAITGGTFVFFADRLPEKHRAAAWSQAYDTYRVLWKVQGGIVEKLPVHLKGELLAGLAQTAERTGRKPETTEYLEKILTLLPGTRYESIARQWKADAATAANTNLACQTCHEPGRLAVRRAALPARR